MASEALRSKGIYTHDKIIPLKYMRVYVAGGWFSPEQETTLNELERLVDRWFKYSFKPRHDANADSELTFKEIFDLDVEALRCSDLVIASTVGKDMGTLWECGYAAALGIPIIYFTPGIKTINLMLAKSGSVVRDEGEFELALAKLGEDKGNYTFSEMELE